MYDNMYTKKVKGFLFLLFILVITIFSAKFFSFIAVLEKLYLVIIIGSIVVFILLMIYMNIGEYVLPQKYLDIINKKEDEVEEDKLESDKYIYQNSKYK